MSNKQEPWRVARSISAAALLGAAALLLACGEPRPAEGADASAPEEPSDPMAIPSKKRRPQPALQDLGPKGRRVKVIVLPGDASVEVDGFAARRRNGVVELTGRVGDVRRLRVLKGASQIEQDVAIEEAGASPAVVDLAAKSLTPAAAASAKPKNILYSDTFE